MVSFVCDGCQATLQKKKVQAHQSKCNSSLSCLDCSTVFTGNSYAKHTSCVSEVQKTHGKNAQATKKAKPEAKTEAKTEKKKQQESDSDDEDSDASADSNAKEEKSDSDSSDSDSDSDDESSVKKDEDEDESEKKDEDEDESEKKDDEDDDDDDEDESEKKDDEDDDDDEDSDEKKSKKEKQNGNNDETKADLAKWQEMIDNEELPLEEKAKILGVSLAPHQKKLRIPKKMRVLTPKQERRKVKRELKKVKQQERKQERLKKEKERRDAKKLTKEARRLRKIEKKRCKELGIPYVPPEEKKDPKPKRPKREREDDTEGQAKKLKVVDDSLFEIEIDKEALDKKIAEVIKKSGEHLTLKKIKRGILKYYQQKLSTSLEEHIRGSDEYTLNKFSVSLKYASDADSE